jgi:hypothetical protein
MSYGVFQHASHNVKSDHEGCQSSSLPFITNSLQVFIGCTVQVFQLKCRNSILMGGLMVDIQLRVKREVT